MNKKIFIDPLIDNNPISRQVLGICSALAVTVKLEQAFVMTLALTFVVTMSNVIISMLRNYIPSSIRIIVQLTVISTLVTLIDKALAAYMYDLSKSLSVFIALIVTNCIVMGRADGFAMQNNIKDSFMDGIGNGLGYGMMLILVAFFRELFGFGTVFDYRVFPETFNNGLMILAPGAFIILGLIIWAQRSMTSFVEE
tara:strand:+ start:424 stop:1014 length:591 start_codon:yes stop_codon:yes gene_type:complete